MAFPAACGPGDLLALAVLGLQVEDQVGYWNLIKSHSNTLLAEVGTYMHNHTSAFSRSLPQSIGDARTAIQELQAVFPELQLTVSDSQEKTQRDLTLRLSV